MDEGHSFIWHAGSTPYLVDQQGRKHFLAVRDYVPYLKDGPEEYAARQAAAGQPAQSAIRGTDDSAHPSQPQKEVPPVLAKLPCVLGSQPPDLVVLLGNQRPFPPRLLGSQRRMRGKSYLPILMRNKSLQMARPSLNALCRFAICSRMSQRTHIVLHVRGPK